MMWYRKLWEVSRWVQTEGNNIVQQTIDEGDERNIREVRRMTVLLTGVFASFDALFITGSIARWDNVMEGQELGSFLLDTIRFGESVGCIALASLFAYNNLTFTRHLTDALRPPEEI